MKHFMKKVARKLKHDNENGARKAVLEDLFYDFNRSRLEVYKMNFVRGIFFGVGSALGATVVIALIAWLLSLFTDLPGGIGNFVQNVVESMNQSR
jgi:hypothetical protein